MSLRLSFFVTSLGQRALVDLRRHFCVESREGSPVSIFSLEIETLRHSFIIFSMRCFEGSLLRLLLATRALPR